MTSGSQDAASGGTAAENGRQERQPPQVSRPAVSWAAFVAGLGLLALCVAASLALALEHLKGLHLPGCGAGSPCARATSSVWGTVPLVQWPVSYVGVAYSAALLAAWPTMRRGVPVAVRWLIRMGVLASVGFVVIMLRGDYVCPYCLATHIGNVAFWVLAESVARRTGGTGLKLVPQATLAGALVLVTAILGVFEWSERGVVRASNEAQANRARDAIVAEGTESDAAGRGVDAARPEGRGSTTWPEGGGSAARAPSRPSAAAKPASAEVAAVAPGQSPPTSTGAPSSATASRPVPQPATASSSQPGSRGFTGRYRLGPAEAPLRIVVFIDYQCKTCNLMEIELKLILEKHPEVSLSVKQWPGGTDCNAYVTELNHANACRAACAAEAAGALRGNDGFWQLHFWLFRQSGRFTDEELRAAVKDFGYDAAEFERVMNSPATMDLIKADIEEGYELALVTTPMIFVNGVEFQGWSTPGNLTRVIDQVSEKHLPAKTAAADHPAPLAERFVLEWKMQRAKELPGGARWTSGPPDATLKILVWGDHQQPKTALVDGIIREFMTTHAKAQYTFRQFPLSHECNADYQQKEEYAAACRAAQAAEAAGKLGGVDGFWKMHGWLLKHQTDLGDDTLRAAAKEMGFDPVALAAAMTDAAVSAAIAADIRAAQDAGLQNSPLIVINGKIVPRWRHGEKVLLRPILDAAAKE